MGAATSAGRTVVGVVATALLVVSVSASICGAAPVARAGATNRADPNQVDVTHHQRFTTTVELDGGAMAIRPAPSRLHPTMSETWWESSPDGCIGTIGAHDPHGPRGPGSDGRREIA